jgi:hypothetical protein
VQPRKIIGADGQRAESLGCCSFAPLSGGNRSNKFVTKPLAREERCRRARSILLQMAGLPAA